MVLNMREYALEQCLNMPETEPKITLQVTQHLQRHRGIQNPAKNLKWSKKERLAKTNYSLELLRHCKNI